MKLRQVAIQSFPGIDRPFEIDGFRDGLNIIAGPNGIGKSRLCAAVRLLLWPASDEASRALVARAAFEHGDRRWQIQHDPSGHRWQADGVDAEAPSMPAEHLDACFFLGLRDLLDDQDRAGRDLAAEVRRQMSGGFDLAEVGRGFSGSVGARIGATERKAVVDSGAEIRRAQLEQTAALGRERELDELRKQAREAEHAAPRAAYFETAISLHGLKAEADRVERERAEFPEAMLRLDGREIERLDRIDENLESKHRERVLAERELEEAVETRRATRLDGPVASSVLATWRARTADLGDVERDLRQARLDENAAGEVMTERRRVLGADHPSEDDPSGQGRSDRDSAENAARIPSIAEDEELFEFLRESQDSRREIMLVRTRLEYLADLQFPEEEARRLKTLRRAVEPLRAWLRAPESDADRTRDSGLKRVQPGAIIVVCGLAAWLLADFVPSIPLLDVRAVGLLAIGFGVALVGLGLHALRRSGPAPEGETDWRAVAQTQFPETVEGPAEWSVESVEVRLRELEDDLAELDSSEKRARDRDVDRRPLEQSLRALEAREKALEARRGALASRLGLDRLRGDAEIVDFARALDAAREAQAEARSASVRRRDLEARWRAGAADLADFLEPLGEARPTDVASARAGLEALEARNRRFVDADAEARRQSALGERIDSELRSLATDRAEIFAQAGVEAGDRAALSRLLDALPRHRELAALVSTLTAQIDHAGSELARAGESDLSERDLAILESEREAARQKAQERSDLEQRIAVIESDAERMSAGHILEEAIAKREAALAALRDRREEGLFARAGAYLVDRVRSDYETVQMPRVLVRARDHFNAFTHHLYTLEVASDEAGSFVAVSNESGERLPPDRLSDGTRAQLILAARLAFAEEAEQGAKLPLFLDEAMDHSDPERFHAIARSLARMVHEQDRQIFYLTNDPTDVEKFERAFAEEGCPAPALHDLEKIRGRVVRIDRPEALRVAPLDGVPRHEVGEAIADYGARLGVPRFDPAEKASAQHLFYLLRDDPDLLHALLEARLTTVGQCQSQLDSGAGLPRAIRDDAGTGAKLPGRIALLETFCLAWREGRGRPIGRSELEASGAVSAKFIDAFAAVAGEFDGDARRLVDAIQARSDSRIHGYRTKSAEKLERYLIDAGHLDERSALSMDEIVERAISTPAAGQIGMKETAELIHEWWTLSHHSKS